MYQRALLQVTKKNTSSSNPISEYLSNPTIMQVMQNSFGQLNKKFNSNKDGHIPSSSVDAYIFTKEGFVPFSSDNSGGTIKTNPSVIICGNNSTPFQNIQKPNSSFLPPPIPLKNKKNHNENQFISNRNEKTKSVSSFNENNKQIVNTSTTYNYSQSIKDNNNNNNITENEDLHQTHLFLVGSIERILSWNMRLKDRLSMYETIAPVISIQEGTHPQQKVMLLRDKTGPILRVQYFINIHLAINDFCIGQFLRCVGRMIDYNILSAESIREAREEEILALPRLSYVCNYSVNNINND